MTGAKIIAVKLSAAHEGDADLIVDIRYSNGGITQVPLDRYASEALMTACTADTADDLIGHGWEKVRHALQVSYSRY